MKQTEFQWIENAQDEPTLDEMVVYRDNQRPEHVLVMPKSMQLQNGYVKCPPIPYSEASKVRTNTIYRHYKTGDLYLVQYNAYNPITKKQVIIYRAMYGEKILWVRNSEVFVQTVQVGREKVPRFEQVKNNFTPRTNKKRD